MKKFFLIAAAAAMILSSCSKNDASENNSESNLIGFSSYTGRATKAGSTFVDGTTTSLLPNGAIFGVFGFNTGVSEFNAATATPTTDTHTANFMQDVPVSFDGTTYTYSPSRYWPTDGANHLLSFFAYYPYNTAAENTIITGKTVTGALNTYTFNFTVPPTATEQVDFMISDVAKDQQYSTNSGVVPMVFHHMLSQVKFKVTLDKAYPSTVINIKGIQLTNIKSTGTLAVNAAADGKVASGSSWNSQGTPADFTVPVSLTPLTFTDPVTYYTPESPVATLLMMPQEIAKDDPLTETIDEAAKLVITYTYQTTGMTTAIEDTKTINLSNATVSSWAKNNNILYTITLGLNAIQFTASVTGWDDVKETPIVL